MDFAENETLAYLYAEALRAGGYRVSVRSVGGLRPRGGGAVAARPDRPLSRLRRLAAALSRRDSRRHGCAAGLRRTLARIDAEPMRLSRAQNRNVFVTKTDTASRLGLARISDLARYWGG